MWIYFSLKAVINKVNLIQNKIAEIIHFISTKSFIYLFIYLFILFYFIFFAFSRATPAAYGGSQAGGLIGAVAAGLRQSYSNSGSELRLRPTPQLRSTPES